MIMNLLPVMKEIIEALEQLRGENTPHFIYTNKMPFSPEDIRVLSRIFKRGDVEITDNTTNNKSVVYSTPFPGVWVTTLWGRSLEFTPILEIVEINWYPQVVAFPPEDVAVGVQQLLHSVAEVDALSDSVREQLHSALSSFSGEGDELRWPLQGPMEDLLHFVLVPGSLVIQAPAGTFTAAQFWGVWLHRKPEGHTDLVISPFPSAVRATPENVAESILRLQEKYAELKLMLPVQGPS